MRLAAQPRESLFSPWIWFDTAIVVVGMLDWIGIKSLGMNANMLRVVRLTRMVRVLRVLRVIHVFDSLFLLITALRASVGILSWSFVLLFTIQVAMGLFLTQMMQSFLTDPDQSDDAKHLVFAYFGTFSNAMVTMFEITLANWVPSCRVLMDNVSHWFGLFYILYCCCWSFAVVRVISAVFLTETMKLVACDENIALASKQRAKMTNLRKLDAFFQELDMDGDGNLTKLEFECLMSHDLLRSLLTVIGIGSRDLNSLWGLIATIDEDMITYHDFINGMERLQGNSSEIDMLVLMDCIRDMQEKLHCLQKSAWHQEISHTKAMPGAVVDAAAQTTPRRISSGSRHLPHLGDGVRERLVLEVLDELGQGGHQEVGGAAKRTPRGPGPWGDCAAPRGEEASADLT